MSIKTESVSNIVDYVKVITEFISSHKNKDKEKYFYFRGERDHGGTDLFPSVYRENRLKKEDIFYHEIIRFNESDFEKDKSTIDHLCRMQHFKCPTRMLDLSEDCFTALYFALENEKSKNKAYVYLFSIPEDKIKFYDSDTATILANLAKLPLNNTVKGNPGNNSKRGIVEKAKDAINQRMTVEEYNEHLFKYLIHKIREDKPYMESKIDLGDIFSVQCVKTKLNNDRVFMQKGAFLLFGLNANDVEKPIPLDGSYGKPNYWRDDWDMVPVDEILKIRIENEADTMAELKNLGISAPYIYPNMEKIGQYLIDKYKK